MFCPKCGTRNDDNAYTCVQCAAVFRARPESLEDNAAMRMILPIGRSGWAIAAGYAGLFALLVFPAPLALLLGIVAVLDMKKHPERHGMGRAVFALITGGLGTAALLYILLGVR